MKKRIIHFLVLFAVFIAGNILFANFMNSHSTESASDMERPTLPVVYVTIEGQDVDRMQGYTMEMDGRKLRECIIPLTTERSITFSYKAYGNKVEAVSYEVITPDTGERVSNAKIGNFRDNGDSRTATFTLSEPILMNREYPICFTLTVDGQEVYYYARLLQRADLIIRQYVEFVNSFYQTSLNKQASGEVNAYIEPDETVVNNSFANVDIHSSLEMITWGNLKPQLFRKATPTITDINATTCSITCDYLISAASPNGGTEIYHVSEYYRMRYNNARVMLLTFERQALQEFSAQNGQITSAGVNVGVSTRDVQYMSNSASSIVAFVQDGALWEFNGSAEKLSLVYTLHAGDEFSDERSDFTDYGIKILRVGESGDLDFVVYGHMNCGAHEGEMGVSFLHYASDRVNVEELAFVPYTGSYEVLARDVETLAYMNTKGIGFVYMDDMLYRIDTEDGSAETVVEEIHPDCFTAAKSGRYAAWAQEMDPETSQTITMMDFESERKRNIRSENGLYVKPIGFINDDLIYGTAAAEDLRELPSGRTLYAMRQITINSFDGTELKEYAPEELWITDVEIQEGLIALTRVARFGGEYTEATSDDIMNNKKTSSTQVKLSAGNSSRQGAVMTLVMPTANINVNPLFSSAKIRTPSRDMTVVPPEAVPSSVDRYFVYTSGRLLDVTTDPAEAVREADEGFGIALDDVNRYIYERAGSVERNELENTDIPVAVLQGTLNAKTLAGSVTDATVLDLTGCTLSQVLYMVNTGSAVVGRTEDGSAVVIVGYDKYNTLLYNEETGEHYYYGLMDSTALFEAGGNVFVTYIEDKTTIKN